MKEENPSPRECFRHTNNNDVYFNTYGDSTKTIENSDAIEMWCKQKQNNLSAR